MIKITNFIKNKQKHTEISKNTSQPVVTINVSGDYDIDLKNIKDYFNYGLSADIKLREFKISDKKAFIIFIEGMVNTSLIDDNILSPLMLLTNTLPTKDLLLGTLVTHNQTVCENAFKKIAQSVNFGDCALFVDGIDNAIICDVKSWDRRGIDAPLTDTVIIGPHEGFNENFKINTALVRKIIRDQNLIVENLTIGKQSNTPCAFMYMKNITNDEFISEFKYRLKNTDVDYIYHVSELEQLIEDSTFSLFPQMIKTERPDRTAEALIEGKIAVILQGSPYALILPVTISEFFITQEDKYLRLPYSNMMRLVRMIGILISVLLPALYLAIVNFHHEMIPTELLFAIESTREAIPFSALTELFIMEISFDLIREASIRVPSPIGSTIGIVGGLIIGQSAVSANIVSPITIIIVSLAGIGSFVTPDYSASLGLRIMRYIYIFLASILGFIGISFGLFLSVCRISETKSLGVSLTQSPRTPNNRFWEYIISYPAWKKEFRHNYLKTKHKRVQNDISKRWAE